MDYHRFFNPNKQKNRRWMHTYVTRACNLDLYTVTPNVNNRENTECVPPRANERKSKRKRVWYLQTAKIRFKLDLVGKNWIAREQKKLFLSVLEFVPFFHIVNQLFRISVHLERISTISNVTCKGFLKCFCVKKVTARQKFHNFR